MKKSWKLFEPVQIRNMTVRNRTVMPSMTTKFADADGFVTERLTDYYTARAKGGTGLISIEMSGIDIGGRHRRHELGIYDDKFIPGLKKLTESVKSHGAKVDIQLGHAGGYASASVTGKQPVAPSSMSYRVYEEKYETVTPKALSKPEIAELVQRFSEAAVRAKEAGFDAVEIHGAHLYLIFQFLSPLSNKRDDEYGGDVKNRARFAVEIVKSMRDAVGEMPIIFRTSGTEFVTGGFSVEDFRIVAKMVEEAGADAIHASAGTSRMPWGAHPPMTFPWATFAFVSKACKEVVSIPVIAVGRLHDPLIAERIITDGVADLIALGRGLIADPEWSNKVAEGRLDDVRMCISCNACTDIMRGGREGLRCSINAEAGNESRLRLQRADHKKRVLVIGGGPAGLEAARVALLRGHDVTLCERKRLGGQLRLAAKGPIFENWGTSEATILGFVDYLSAQVRKLGGTILVGEEVVPELIDAWNPEVVVVATGASYVFPLNFVAPHLITSRLLRKYVSAAFTKPSVKKLAESGIRRSNRKVLERWKSKVPELYVVGDCAKPRKTMYAVYDGSEAGRRI